MKKLPRLLLSILLPLAAFWPASLQAQTIQPDYLRCEYRENPLGADMAKPRLSWIANPANPQLRGLRQSAYQVLAASSPELLTRDQGDLWDSAKVASAEMNQIAYAGKALVSNQAIYWKVRLWDQAGAPSAWSPVSRWTMGVLTENDWQNAKWIGAPDANEPFAKDGAKGPKEKYESVLLRRNFPVKAGLKRAIAHLCGLAQYEKTLNGAKVGDAVFTPGWTAYNKTCLYDTYDITASLKPGANAVGLFLGNGFYNTHGERYTKVRGSFGPLQAIGLIRLEYADGSVENVVTDEKWKTASGPIVFSSVYGGEDYDARLFQKGWDQPTFNDLSWEKPATTKGPGGVLRGLSASAPPIREMQVLAPVGKKEINDNVTVYDLGQNASIMAVIKVKGAAGATVKVTPSELIHDNGDINERMTDNQSYCTYTLNGQGEEAYQWKFYYRGGRYLRVETKAAPGGSTLPVVSAVEGRAIRADAPAVGQFSTSSDLVNKIFGLVRWAQMSNMMSVMTDCPHREKLGWLEQIQLNGPALRYNFDMTGIFRKGVNDMADAQRANGLVPSLVPNYYNWDEGKFTTPIQWGSAFILVPWQQYEFEGDAQMLKDRYDAMKRYMDYLARRSDKGIIGFGLGDWYDNLGEGEPTLTPVALTDTAFFYQNYVIMGKIATLLGKRDDAAQFQKTGAEVRKAFNDKFYNAATGNYATGSQGSNCLPISMNIAEPEWRAPVSRNLLLDLQAKNTTTGEVSYRYLLRALADADLNDLVYSTYTSETNGYGLQVKMGKTSLTEAWNGGNASQNHFMFGQINEWYYRDLAGIQSDLEAPGFKKIVIKPALVGDLTFVKASYRSINGDIVSHWTNGPTGATLNVTIPVGTNATIHVPAANAALVKESGIPAATAPGLKFLRMEKGAAIYAAGSGSYAFSSSIAATAPSRLTVTPQAGQVVLTWPASMNATSYTLKRSTTLGSGYVPLAASLANVTYTDTGLKNGTTYYYAVSAINASGESKVTEASATPSTIINSGFETPTISGFVANPSEAGWQFTAATGNNGSGLTKNGSGYTGSNPGKIPEGEQAAFLQGSGTISQPLGGLIPGATYTLIFSAAQRVSSNNGGQTWQVKLDGKIIGEFSPDQTATNYIDYKATFRPTGKRQVLSFVGTNTRGGDNTVFIDNIRITVPGQQGAVISL